MTEPRPPAADPSPPGGPPPQPSGGVDLERLVRRHQSEVWRFLRYLGAEAAEADDLTQETFLAVAAAAFVERSDTETRGYLRTVARRQLLMLRRTQSRRIATVELDAAETVWSDAFGRSSSDLWDEHVEAARRCAEQLEGRARRAIDLRYRDGAGRDAMAAVLEMSRDGVKTLLRRTRATLRDCIEKRLAAAGA